MANTATRLITLIMLLQRQPNQTAAQLAQALDVSVRTVQRYITMLDEIGIPVYAERGPAREAETGDVGVLLAAGGADGHALRVRRSSAGGPFRTGPHAWHRDTPATARRRRGARRLDRRE